MAVLPIVRFLTAALSLLVLAAAAYLLWSWHQGDVVATAAGELVRDRQAWRGWVGGALLALSFLGRPLWLLVLAMPDGRRTWADREAGQFITSPTGAELYVSRYGRRDGPPIILTHGWGMDSTFWHYAKRDLGGHHELILWDLPGLGLSKLAPDKQLSLERMADDLAAVITLNGARPAVLVGHSIGGMIIQTLIREHPAVAARLAGVVLLNTTHTNPLKTMIFGRLLEAVRRPVLQPAMKLVAALQPLFWLAQWQSYLSGQAHMAMRLGFGRYVTRSQLEHVTLLTTRNPPGVQAKGNLAMFHWDSAQAIARLAQSALVVGADRDIITKLEASRTIAGWNEQARLEVIEGANHMGPLERADLYNRMIGDFVAAAQPRVVLTPPIAGEEADAALDLTPRPGTGAAPLH